MSAEEAKTGDEESKTRIYLDPQTKSDLRKIGNRGQSDDDVIRGLMDAKGLYDASATLATLTEALEEPLNTTNVTSFFMRVFTKLGAAIGYTGESFFNWGLSDVQKAKVITFFKDNDPVKTRMRLAVGSLQGLIKDGYDVRDELVSIVEKLKKPLPEEEKEEDLIEI